MPGKPVAAPISIIPLSHLGVRCCAPQSEQQYLGGFVISARSANDEDEDAAHFPPSSPPRTELRESDGGDGGNLMST